MKKKDAEIVEVIAEEKTIPIRDMSRKQVKDLRAAGLDPAFTTLDTAKTAELIDWIVDKIYPDVDLDSMPYYKVNILAMATYRQAMGGPEEIKNS